MAQSDSSQEQHENTYVIDAESGAEMARLLDQDKLVTLGMGGLFPEQTSSSMSNIARILDIGCGPGGWVHEVAHAYPAVEVIGIDISQRMISYARAHAQVRKLRNAHFYVMDALKPLDFPDESFDMVNARSIVGFVPADAWSQLIAESRRILCPGGILRLNESEWGFTNKPAIETLMTMTNKALHLTHHSFSPTGQHLGITPMLGWLLRNADFQHIKHMAHALEASFGTPMHAGTFQNLSTLFKLAEPLYIKLQLTTKEEFERLYEQALADMQATDFCTLSFMLTAWGEKR